MASQRGILGVKKDPKRQMLFSFHVRDGEEWPSSDSEDSDYAPDVKQSSRASGSSSSEAEDTGPAGRPSGSSAKRRKTDKKHKTQTSTKRTKNDASKGSKSTSSSSKLKQRKLLTDDSNSNRRSSPTESTAAQGSSNNSHTPVPHLPPEIWRRIFQCYVAKFGPLPFLCRAAKVCRSWRDLATCHTLWQIVDLSFGWIKSKDATLHWLAHNRLAQCREVSLAGWKNLTNEAVKELSDRCPQLQSVNLSNCRKLTSVAVGTLVNSHPAMRDLDLSFASADAVSAQLLKLVAEKLGSSLNSLVLSGTILKGFNLVMNAIMDQCPNLEVLDLSNCTFSTDFFILNVERLQKSCPNMRILRLANCKVRANSISSAVEAAAPGFTKLQQLSCAMPQQDAPTGSGVPDDLLRRLVHKAEDLQLLDLRGCTQFRLCTLESTAATNVEHVYLSLSSVGRDSHSLEAVVSKWRHSLQTLDLSWTQPREDDLVNAIKALAAFPACPLTHLDLSGVSAATSCVVRNALTLPKLQSINLTSCRPLPRGVKCLHEGTKALKKLKKAVDLDVSDSDTDSY